MQCTGYKTTSLNARRRKLAAAALSLAAAAAPLAASAEAGERASTRPVNFSSPVGASTARGYQRRRR